MTGVAVVDRLFLIYLVPIWCGEIEGDEPITK